ncbi:MAG: hypothetical protein AB1635_09605 [Acidobacteriota bacterium]
MRYAHAFGHLPLLDDVALQVEPGERIAVIEVIKRTLARIEAIDGELLDLLARWDELDSVSG